MLFCLLFTCYREKTDGLRYLGTKMALRAFWLGGNGLRYLRYLGKEGTEGILVTVNEMIKEFKSYESRGKRC